MTIQIRTATVHFPDTGMTYSVSLGHSLQGFLNGMAHLTEMVVRKEYAAEVEEPKK